MKNQKINSETSYKTLKNMVPDASAVHTPKGETLINSDAEILIKVTEDSGTVIVYKNGFFAYIDDLGNVTARAVANCHVMKFEKIVGGFETVTEEQFENLPFGCVLSHFGMENIKHKEEMQVSRHENISLDAEELPNDSRLTAPNFADELDLDGEGDIWEKRLAQLPEAMDKLTDRQREVAFRIFGQKKTQGIVAAELGITDRAVRYHLEAIEKKFKKYRETTS